MGVRSHRQKYYESPHSRHGRMRRGNSSLETLFQLVEKATGIQVSFHDLSGVTHMAEELRLGGISRSHSDVGFCIAAKGSPKAFRACIRSKYCSNYVAWKRSSAFIGCCHMGVANYVWPVAIEKQLIGVLYLGGVDLFGAPVKSARSLDKNAIRLKLDLDQLRREKDNLPHIERKELEAFAPYLEACEQFILNSLQAKGISMFMLPKINRRRICSFGTTHWLLKRVLEYIHESYNYDISLSTVAQQLHVRPQYLCRVFRQEQGLSFTNYLHHYRVEKAKQLFALGKASVTEVAGKVGFNAPSYFSRIFTKVTGQSPQKYLRHLRRQKLPRFI